MAALDVLPLAVAKRYLNMDHDRDDVELQEDFIPPAVERVERHLGRTLVDYASTSPSERLALKMVLAEYWRTQRTRGYGGGAAYGAGGASAAVVEGDSGPAGLAPLGRRLTELLGRPTTDESESGPRGVFPAALPWPDPART